MTSLKTARELIAKSKAAHEEICALAKGKEWRMCIPVQPTDSDMVLQAPLDGIEQLAQSYIEAVEVIRGITGNGGCGDCRDNEDARKDFLRKIGET